MIEDNWRGRLVSLMEAANLNPRKLSLKAGLNPTAVRDILDHRSRSPQLRTMNSLASVLGCTVDDLLGAGPSSRSVASVQTDLRVQLSQLNDALIGLRKLVDDMNLPIPYSQVVSIARRQWNLTERELQILGWAALGKSDIEIGIIELITVHTVNMHFRGIFAKMEVSTRALAIAKALEAGLLEPILQHLKCA